VSVQRSVRSRPSFTNWPGWLSGLAAALLGAVAQAGPKAPPPRSGSGAEEVLAPPSEARPVGLPFGERVAVAWARGPLLSAATLPQVEADLVRVALLSPVARKPMALPQPKPACGPDDDACFLAAGARQGVDAVVVLAAVPAPGGAAVRARKLQVATRQRSAEVAQGGLSTDPRELEAAGQALACQLLVSTGCWGELRFELTGAALLEDGTPLPLGSGSPARVRLPLGVHQLSARQSGRAGPVRSVPVLLGGRGGAPWRAELRAEGAPALVQAETTSARP
jgi:hypothetical protein